MKIRYKIALWVVGAGLLTSFVFSLVVFMEMREQPLEILDSQLEAASNGLVSYMIKRGKISVAESGGKLIILPSKHYWLRIYDQKLRPIYQSDSSKIIDLPLYRDRENDTYTISAATFGNNKKLNQGKPNEIAFRVRVTPFKIGNALYLVQMAMPIDKLEEETFDLLTSLGIGMGISAIILLGISYFFAGYILKPVASINRFALKIDEKTLGQRIPLGKNRDEIFELSNCLNNMLDRLESSFIKQKQYLADASHELKSPLAMLRLFFEEAAQGSDVPAHWREKLLGQQHNLLRMDRLVKNLLELSALEVGKSLNIERFCLADLLRSLLDDFAPLLEKAAIELEIDLPQQLIMQGDRDKINRVFINLIDNAIKYNVTGGIIKLNATADHRRINISLSNTGPGIPKNEYEKVFEQFYRVEKSRSTQYGGAGLGLAIVKEIIRLHQGDVSITSKPGEWTRVEINLPINHAYFTGE